MKISIAFCVVWHYNSQAVSLAEELLERFGSSIQALCLIPSSSGRFEVQVDETLVYSKLQTGRHAEPGEITRLIEKFLKA